MRDTMEDIVLNFKKKCKIEIAKAKKKTVAKKKRKSHQQLVGGVDDKVIFPSLHGSFKPIVRIREYYRPIKDINTFDKFLQNVDKFLEHYIPSEPPPPVPPRNRPPDNFVTLGERKSTKLGIIKNTIPPDERVTKDETERIYDDTEVLLPDSSDNTIKRERKEIVDTFRKNHIAAYDERERKEQQLLKSEEIERKEIVDTFRKNHTAAYDERERKEQQLLRSEEIERRIPQDNYNKCINGVLDC